MVPANVGGSEASESPFASGKSPSTDGDDAHVIPYYKDCSTNDERDVKGVTNGAGLLP